MRPSMQRPLQPILAKDSQSITTTTSSSPASSSVGPLQTSPPTNTTVKPNRPCDACRRRKSRCVIPNPESQSCALCAHHNQPCTFVEDPAPRKRKATGPAGSADMLTRSSKRLSPDTTPAAPTSAATTRSTPAVDATQPQESLLKNTLGLQTHQHAKYIGATDEHDLALLDLRLYDEFISESASERVTFRNVGYFEFFRQFEDTDSPSHIHEIADLDAIQQIVHPHGDTLVKLYFKVIHPSFPILHKRVFMEKYARSYREFSPPLLAAVYILALNWWSYSPNLALSPRPDISQLETIALRSLQDVATRAKLSTVQAGILLLQRMAPSYSWQLTSQLVSIGQDLGLHLDCTYWRIPNWERSLRKRLAWALFMQDTWSALIYGRPPHIHPHDWVVQPLDDSEDYPESSQDEAEDEEDIPDIEKGRTLFNSMITLTKLLAEVIEALYSQRAEQEIRAAYDSTKVVLERAKPIQLKLRAFFNEMPDNLRMDYPSSSTSSSTSPSSSTPSSKPKLSSVGYLHLAYFATEITLHRRILRSLSPSTPPPLTQICRSAAKARLISALEYFNRLHPHHLQSFWYFASKFNFALIGTFASICFVTSVSPEEAEFYQRRLQEYRWVLRISRKQAEFLDIASEILESSVGVLLRNADSLDSKKLAFPMLQVSVDDNIYATSSGASPRSGAGANDADDGMSGMEGAGGNVATATTYAEGTGTDDAYYDDVSMGSQ